MQHLRMPDLTWRRMILRLKSKNKALFSRVRPGDRVHFTVVQDGKDHVITQIK